MSEQFSTDHIDKAIEKLNTYPEQSIADDLKVYFTRMLKNADFVQIVRCKNCKHSVEVNYDGPLSYKYLCIRKSTVTHLEEHEANYFCADGERKENE